MDNKKKKSLKRKLRILFRGTLVLSLLAVIAIIGIYALIMAMKGFIYFAGYTVAAEVVTLDTEEIELLILNGETEGNTYVVGTPTTSLFRPYVPTYKVGDLVCLRMSRGLLCSPKDDWVISIWK